MPDAQRDTEQLDYPRFTEEQEALAALIGLGNAGLLDGGIDAADTRHGILGSAPTRPGHEPIAGDADDYPPTGVQSLHSSPEFGRVAGIPLEITVELGRARLLIRDILGLNVGSIVELDRIAGEPVDLLANGKLVARGEVVVIDNNFGVRLIELIPSVGLDGIEAEHARAA